MVDRQPLLLGYADRASVAPGETISFCVSCEGRNRYRAEIVRLIHGDVNPAGPGYKAEPIATTANGDYPGRPQRTHIGSYVEIDDRGVLALESFTVECLAWPTLPCDAREQALLGRWSQPARSGYVVLLDRRGTLVLRVGDGTQVLELTVEEPLAERVWYSIRASFDAAASSASLSYEPVVNSANSRVGPTAGIRGGGAVATLRLVPAAAPAAFLIAAYGGDGGPAGHYDGKLERPRVLGSDGTLQAAWDFSAGISRAGIASDRVMDMGPRGLHGTCVNLPARAMTGAAWTGHEHDYRQAPDQYGAIHFHHDDLEDAGWEADFEFQVPTDLRTGVYAAWLRAGNIEEHIPFCVLPPRGTATARALVVLPTATYMAYANEHQSTDAGAAELLLARALVLDERDVLLSVRREIGLSMYDSHADGSGVCYSSRLRPILTWRPKYVSPMASGPWGFNADLYLIDWLTETGHAFDVATDEDLHHEGLDLLRRYRVVLTGTHPEYSTEAMLDALERWVADEGGRVMYLGGNGFYWVTSYHPAKQHVIEVRRGFAGIRAWESQPGEVRHATSGEQGGLWRYRGRPPQKLVGVGFAAEGLDESSIFRRLSDSEDPRVAWLFAGVDGETIGAAGLQLGGAAGLELDRYDLMLGTPPDTLLLASSEGHGDSYLLAVEEVPVTVACLGATQNPRVRGDIVLYTTHSRGAIFATSSISWCGALSQDGYDGDVSRITRNVLERFAGDEPVLA